MRGWSHGKTKQVLTGGSREDRPIGDGDGGRARLGVGGDLLDRFEDRLHARDPAQVGAADGRVRQTGIDSGDCASECGRRRSECGRWRSTLGVEEGSRRRSVSGSRDTAPRRGTCPALWHPALWHPALWHPLPAWSERRRVAAAPRRGPKRARHGPRSAQSPARAAPLASEFASAGLFRAVSSPSGRTPPSAPAAREGSRARLGSAGWAGTLSPGRSSPPLVP